MPVIFFEDGMGFVELVLLSFGLAMDAFAVGVTDGMCLKRCGIREALAIGLCFGFFQAAMPVVGFFCGSLFYQQIRMVDHWIAFGLLAFLGIRMIGEGIKSAHQASEAACSIENERLSIKVLVTQGIATSIDAMAAGISLSAVQANILFAALFIGAVTAALCFAATFVGRRFGDLLNDKAQMLGGVILVAIGLRVLVSHLMA